MNSNQPKKLTQKQKELVNRLEEIRRNTRSNQSQDVASSKNRNKQQNRPVATGSRPTVTSDRKRTSSQEKFSRPITRAPIETKPRTTYKQRYVRPTQRKQSQKDTPKEKEVGNYINHLSNGKKLAQAIILSEILDKPLSMRKRR